MRKVLWWLIGGSRGGRNRFRILRTLEREPMNANQLATELDLDYKTVRHHLDLLVENDVIESVGDGYGDVYFLTDRMEQNVDVLQEIATTADIDVPEPSDSEGSDTGGESDE